MPSQAEAPSPPDDATEKLIHFPGNDLGKDGVLHQGTYFLTVGNPLTILAREERMGAVSGYQNFLPTASLLDVTVGGHKKEDNCSTRYQIWNNS